jgi:LuxR family transcriptional regulator of csgAB operon
MLARCLDLATKAKCQVACDISQIHALAPLKTKDEQRLIVLDCQEKDPDELLAELKSCLKHKLSRHIVALYNVSEDVEIEESCLCDGIRGLFYEQDSFELFTKGVQAILDGKLWFPREMMEKWLLEGADRRSLPNRETAALKPRGADILTRREAEILTMVAVGSTNDEIADELCISPKTVKAHLYNTFKKINVTSRLQATLWTAENL